MKAPKVISAKQLPARLPVFASATAWLLLDRLQAPDWLMGVVATLFAIIWAVSLTMVWKQQSVELKELA